MLTASNSDAANVNSRCKNRQTYAELSTEKPQSHYLKTTDRAKNEKNVLCKHVDRKALFTGMLWLYVAIHRDMKDTLLPGNTRGAEEADPQSRHRKKKATLRTAAATARRRRQKNLNPSRFTRNSGQ
jgi:hypothetical protein